MSEVFGVDSAIFSNAFSGFSGTITMVILYLFIGAILFACWYLLSFKHKVRIYKETNNGRLVIDTKARQFKTKEGVVKWRFLKYLNNPHPAPSQQDMSLTEKGKLSGECYMTTSGQVTWLKRDIVGDKHIELSGEEIQMLADQMRRGDEYKKKRISDILLQWQGAIVLVMILVIFMMFFNKTVEPSIALGNELKVSAIELRDATHTLADAYARAYPEIVPRNGTIINGNVGDIVNNKVPN